MAHVEARRLFVVFDQLSVLEKDIAFVPAAVIPQDGHQGRTPRGLVGRLNPGEGAWQVRVSVQHKEIVPQQRQGLLERPTRAQQLDTVERILDYQAEISAIPNQRLHLFTEMADAKHHSVDALILQQPELMKDEGPAGNAQQHLRHAIGRGTKPSGQAAGEYGNRQHDYERTTLVPSKSKRKR